MKLIRVASIIAVVLLVLVAGVVLTAAISGERLLAAAIERVGPSMVGRQMSVKGTSIDWGRFTTVAGTDLVVADAAWNERPAMLTARRVAFTIDLLDVLRLRLSPMRLSVQHPTLHLARNAQGRWNLPRAESGSDASSGRVLDKLASLREIDVENGELTVDDLTTPGIEGRLTAFSARVPQAADGVEFDGVASRDGGAPVAFSGRVGSIAELLRRGDDAAEPFPVGLTVGAETARLSATGHFARPLELGGVDLRIQGQGDDLAPLLAAFVAAPAVTTPPFQLAARLTNTEHGWEMGDVAARLGESQIRGKVALSFRQRYRPRLSVDLVAPRIMMSELDWLASTAGDRDATPNSLADAQLPTGRLRRADASGKLRVKRLEGLLADPAGLRLGFELNDGRLHVQPLRLELAQGVAEGTATIDATAGEALPGIALRLDASDLRLGPLLAAFGINRVAGTLRSASIDLRGRGVTPRAVAAALDRKAHFRMVDGSIDVPGLSHVTMGLVETLGFALGGSSEAMATPVTCAVGDFPVRGGVILAERFAVLIPRVVIVGEGTVRLGDATMRLTLTPRPLDDALFRIVVPVVISGRLLAPEVTKHPELRAGILSEATTDICRDGVRSR